MEFLKEILEALQGPLLTLIEASAAAAVPFILYHFNAWMKARSHDARFHCAMDKVTQYAETAVLDIAARYTKGVRSSGKWDGDAAAQAKDLGLAKLQGLLGPAGLNELKGCLGHDAEGVTGVLEGGLEKAYIKLKQAGLLPPKNGEPTSAASDASADAGA